MKMAFAESMAHVSDYMTHNEDVKKNSKSIM